jgi:uncharacterized protein (DUF885 family)
MRSRLGFGVWWFLVLTATLVGACGGAAPKAEAPSTRAGTSSAAWDALSARYLERAFRRDPGLAVAEGRHEFDGRLMDMSVSAIEGWVAELHQQRAEAEAIPAGELDAARRFEQKYLLATIDASLFWSERVHDYQRSPLVYSNVIDPTVYLTRAYAPLEQRLRAYVAHARGIPAVVDAMIANLRTPLPRTFVDVGVKVFGGLVPYLQKDVPPIFASVKDARAQEELTQASALAAASVKRATAWLEAQRAGADDGFALGPELFRELLWKTERVDTSLELLQAAGKRDLEQNLGALESACTALMPGNPLSACAALIAEDKPARGPVAEARAQVSELKQFVLREQLVSIPGPEEARVEEAPPYKRWNQAYIEIPGPYEVGLPSIYYIAPPDPAWTEEERKGYLPGRMDLMFITVHEVWPGHFLQFLHANRVARPLGRVFVGYAFAEGWAHYAEELTWEAGLYKEDPRAHIGQLLNALLRDARLLSAIGLHTGGMTVEESERLFRERALVDPANARQQAARGTFDPAYLNYTLGKLIIRKLREDWTSTRGGRSAYRAFHDQLLSYGGPPLPLVREAMLGSAGDLL